MNIILEQQNIIYPILSTILISIGLLIIIISMFPSKEEKPKSVQIEMPKERIEFPKEPKRMDKIENSIVDFMSSIKDHPFKNLVKTFLFIFVFKKLYEKVLHKKLNVNLDSLKEYIFSKNS